MIISWVIKISVKEMLEVHGKPPKEVYYDLENSGLVPPEVVEAMIPYFNKVGYGHPSITHKPGWEAYEVVVSTKELIARTLGVNNIESLVFTHGGTEANNLAILGTALANRDRKGKIVVSAIEHLSVIFPAEMASDVLGFNVVKVPVDEYGFVDPEVLKYYVDKDTVLVSIQAVNHEIGTIQKIKELVDVVKASNKDALFHVDACDAYGRLPLNLNSLDIDLLSLSSHKIHGPRGVGVLYVKEGVKLDPPLRGQLSVEKLWPGVENVPLIAGFKKAVELAFTDFEGNVSKMKLLRDQLLEGIVREVSDVVVNGPLGNDRVVDNVNVSVMYVEGEALTVELSQYGIYVSSGSACTSRYLQPSHVLVAIGREYEVAHGSILLKVSRYHDLNDVKYTLEVLPKAVDRLRKISALKPKR